MSAKRITLIGDQTMLTGRLTFDQPLAVEISRLERLASKVTARPDKPLPESEFKLLITTIMITRGDVDIMEVSDNEAALTLRTGFKRSPDLVIEVCLALEVATNRDERGLAPVDALARAVDPQHWRKPEPLPDEIVPLVKQYRRKLKADFPETRSIPVEQLWWILLPRFIELGWIERCPFAETPASRH